MIPMQTLSLLLTFILVATLPTVAQDASSDKEKIQRKKRLDAFIEHAKSYRIELSEPSVLLEFNAKPLFSWHTARPNLTQQGSVFAWEYKGRPEVVATIFSHEPADKPIDLLQEMHSVSMSPLTARKGEKVYWSPTSPGVEPKLVPESGMPAKSIRLRLAQMRSIARRFTGSQVNYEGQRSSLRLLPQPIHRTGKEHPRVLDGAIFCLMSDAGTDPEVLVVIEALREEGEESASWHYSLGRFTDLKTWVQLDKKEVWAFEEGTKGPHVLAGPTDTHRFSFEGRLKLN